MPLLDYSFDMSKIDFSKTKLFNFDITVDGFGLGLEKLKYALDPRRQRELREKTKREMDDLNLGQVVGDYNVSDLIADNPLLEIRDYFSQVDEEMMRELDFLNEKKKYNTGQPLTIEERVAWIDKKLNEKKGIGLGAISNGLSVTSSNNNKRNIIIGVGVLVLILAGYLIIKNKK